MSLKCPICQCQVYKELRWIGSGFECSNPLTKHKFLKCPVHQTLQHINLCNKYVIGKGYVNASCPMVEKFIKEKTGYGIYERNNPHKACICIPFSGEMHMTSHKYCQPVKGMNSDYREWTRIFPYAK